MLSSSRSVPGVKTDPDAALIPAVRFDFAELTPKLRIDAWREACDGFYDPTIDANAVKAANACFTWHRLDNLMFSSGISYPHCARRTAAHVRRQTNYVRLLFPGDRASTMVIDGRVVELCRGTIHLVDYSRPFVHLRNHDITLDGVYIPHDEIGYDPARHPAYLGIGTARPIGQVLASAYLALKSRLSLISISEAPTLATGFKELVGALALRNFGTERTSTVPRSARREAMRTYIERNLRTRSLDAACLAREFSVSRPTLYRDFEEVGGVARHIMGRRLERAFIELAGLAPGRGVVRKVSEKWRFESHSHFTRRFRERFGMTPNEVVNFGWHSADATRTPGSLPGLASRDCVNADRLSAWFARR